MLTSPVVRNQSGGVKGGRARVKNDRDEVKVKEEGRLEEIRERDAAAPQVLLGGRAAV